MRLTLRGRLTLWYTCVLSVLLVASSVTLFWAHGRLALAAIDRDLQSRISTADGVLADELREGLPLPAAVLDAINELELPGAGVAFLTEDGRVLGSKTSGVARPLALESLPLGTATVRDSIRARNAVLAHGDVRVRIATWVSLVPLTNERRMLRDTLAVGVPFALLMAGVGGWTVGRRGLRPLARMADEAERITADRPTVRLSRDRAPDELERLAVAFNALLDRLSSALLAQRQFMADASHQLRTPVSIARTATQVTLGRNGRTESEYRDSLQVVSQQLERLTRLVEDMFFLASTDAQERAIDAAPFYLDELVNDCARAASVLAGRGVRIVARPDPDLLLVGDEHLLRQMLLNLIDNALRHSPPDGVVTIAAQRADDRIRIAVEDSGQGVPAEARERIFERFVRLAPAGSSGGGGLGLPIARWIARAHGGDLTLESTATARGRFVATIPIDSSATTRAV